MWHNDFHTNITRERFLHYAKNSLHTQKKRKKHTSCKKQAHPHTSKAFHSGKTTPECLLINESASCLTRVLTSSYMKSFLHYAKKKKKTLRSGFCMECFWHFRSTSDWTTNQARLQTSTDHLKLETCICIPEIYTQRHSDYHNTKITNNYEPFLFFSLFFPHPNSRL